MNKEFTKESAREYIAQQEGFIVSSGTLNTASLLASAHDMLVNIAGMEETTERIARLFQLEEGERAEYLDFYEDERITVIALSEAVDMWQEVSEEMQSLAPDGYYFGSHAGNGSDIGFFQAEEE